MLIHTTRGLIEKDQLELKDIIEWHDNARVIATEWFFQGEMVRRDVHVNALRGLSAAGEAGSM
jgi:hypothetical protein